MAKFRIFLIDDEPENVAYLARCFKDQKTWEFTSTADVVAKAQQVQPDVVIADYRMPNENGVELLRRLRNEGLSFGALVVTAFPDLDEVVWAEQSNLVYRIIPKPFLPAEIRQQFDLALADRVFQEELLSGAGFSQVSPVHPSAEGDTVAPRISRRIPTVGFARVECGGDCHDLRIIDVALGGVGVEGQLQLSAMQTVFLHHLNIGGKQFEVNAKCRVVWLQEEPDHIVRAGLSFEANTISWNTIAPMLRQAYVARLAQASGGLDEHDEDRP